MSEQVINVGAAANDGTGDTIRVAFQKVVSMFSELYASIASLTTSVDGIKSLGYASMIGNGTATTIAGTNTPVKIAGTFTLEALSQNYTLASNALVCGGSQSQVSEITVNCSLTTTAANVTGLYIYKNGVKVANSVSVATATAAGKAENCISRTFLSLVAGDQIDAWVENQTAVNNITVVNCVVSITPARAM